MTILGIHSGHDASLALVVDGKLVSSISVERYSRNKKDEILSRNALDRFLSGNRETVGFCCSKTVHCAASYRAVGEC